jgi:hypothetical protein
VAQRLAGRVDDTGDPVGPGVHGGVRDRPSAGVPDEDDRAVAQGVDQRNHGVDLVAKGDAGTVGVPRLHAGQRHGVRTVARLLEDGRHLVPRRAVEPETGDEHDVHGRRG